MLNKTPKNQFKIDVDTQFLAGQSEPEKQHYVFAYTITITNTGDTASQLKTRYWQITDGDGIEEEVHGVGVVGQQPYIAAGESFKYTSGAVLKTPVGFMQGSYQMISHLGEVTEAAIPAFVLATPGTLH